MTFLQKLCFGKGGTKGTPGKWLGVAFNISSRRVYIMVLQKITAVLMFQRPCYVYACVVGICFGSVCVSIERVMRW